METIKAYDLFICHPWQYTIEYNFVVEMLNKEPRFYWRNYSFPEHDTIINPDSTAGKKQLYEELEGQIKYANAVLIISKMYNEHSYWVEKELELAAKHKRPVILIKSVPNEEIPGILTHQADEIVNGDANSITSGIKKVIG